MKKLYFVISFLLISFSYGQESKPGSADINGFKLYPNPVTNGKVYIVTAQNAPKQILIFNVLGTQVLSTFIVGNELSVADLDAGVYVIRVFEKDKVATRKLIIK